MVEIPSKSSATLEKIRNNKTQLLPLVEDVVTLSNHLKSITEKIKKSCINDQEQYVEFAKMCLAEIKLFNKRRSGEAERMIKENAGVLSTNKFTFARPGKSENPYRGNDCLRLFAINSETEHPQLKTSTRLLKLAVLAQVLNLQGNSQDKIAIFQGHYIRVHWEHYRLQESAT
ncbi:unnamed protein product [Mytilus coruscus]|uniref:Uncharacterized protein n=1 Tax=Mytilus coruscus TaxID=42192 RepID=A0A6J8EXZ5_MYTCO|nr:unnamed protein product [Mytilus coruscus]